MGDAAKEMLGMGASNFWNEFVNIIVTYGNDLLMPAMLALLILGLVFRLIIHHTVKREYWFAKEFDKRVNRFLLQDKDSKEQSFYSLSKKILEKTYYEIFELRAIMKRRKPDSVASLSDRLFLIQNGCAWLVRDTLHQIRFLKFNGSTPKLLEIAKTVFRRNPAFSRVFGTVPVGGFNDVLNLLPGLFIVFGIFGTFLGIMKALPELRGMDLTDANGTKAVMDAFLLKIAFAMGTSIVGIIFNIIMIMINTTFSPEKIFVDTVEQYENSLDLLWNRAANNNLPPDTPEFDEHKDPIEALAADSVNKELQRKKVKDRGAEDEQKAS